jgi:hypothetical protein
MMLEDVSGQKEFMVLGFGGPFWGGERELEFLVEGDCENS